MKINLKKLLGKNWHIFIGLHRENTAQIISKWQTKWAIIPSFGVLPM